LAISTSIWGFGFIAVKWSYESFGPYWSHGMRFILAALISLPFIIYFKMKNEKIYWKEGFIVSLFLTGTLVFQNIGLVYTTVAKSGFLTTMYSLFVPLILILFFKKKFRKTFWLLIILAMVGMMLLCNLSFNEFNKGDWITLLCALSAAFHIIYISHVTHYIERPILFNLIQNFWTAIIAIPLAFIFEGKPSLNYLFEIQSNTFKGIIFLAIVSSLLAFSIQMIAQKKIPSHIAGIIFLLESPFAALFGYVFLNEKLTFLNIMGAIFIVISVVLIPILGREVTTPKRGHN